MLLRELRHIQLDEGVLISEEELSQCLGELSFTNTRGPGKDERTAGTLRVLEPCATASNRLRQSLDGLRLANNATVQFVFHIDQLGRLSLRQLDDWDTRRHSENLRNIVLGDLKNLGLPRTAPLRFHFLASSRDLLFLIPQGGGALEVLIVNGGFFSGANLGDLVIQFADLRRRRHAANTQPCPSLVHQVNGLVRQETIRNVTIRKRRRRLNRLIRDNHFVVCFVAVTQTLEDPDGLLHRRLIHLDGLETTFEGGIFLNVLAVLIQRGGADGLQFAARKHGLEHLRCIN